MPIRSHIVFAGGGTAGHLFPGLAVAAQMQSLEPELRITFCGTGRSFERDHVIAAGHEYLVLPCRPLPRRLRQTFGFLTDNLVGYYAARRFLLEQSVSLVVGLGGYASAPAARAAVSQRIPLLLLEQNAVPGRVTRWLARRATLVCGAFAEVRARLAAGVRLKITGNPLRAGFESFDERTGTEVPVQIRDQPRLLVLGGSGGARSLNQHVPRAIHQAGAALAGWSIVHQCGQHELEATTSLYAKLAISARVTPFIDDMPAELAATDLAVSRAGGTTLAELAAAHLPAILLPFPSAANNHQWHNAEVFRAAGACRLIDERQADGRLNDRVAAELRLLAAAPTLRGQMGAAAGRQNKPQAALRVAQLALDIDRTAIGLSTLTNEDNRRSLHEPSRSDELLRRGGPSGDRGRQGLFPARRQL